LANETDKSVAQTARGLGINENTLHTWTGKYSRPVENTDAARTDEHLYEGLKRLKKEVAQLTEERKRNLLKKVAAHFAKEQRSTAWMQELGQRRSSCREVRLDKATARRISNPCDMPVYGRFPKRSL
jgi:transposase